MNNTDDAPPVRAAGGITVRSGHLVVYLVALASIFVILFGIRGSAYIINPILLAAVITITVLPVPSRLTQRGVPGWLALVLSILMVVVVLGVVIATVFFSITRLSTELPTYLASASQQTQSSLSAVSDNEILDQIESQIGAVSTSVGPAAQNLLASVANLLVQFGLALVIFFFMISAALALPAPSRLGLDPNSPMVGRITALTEDVRKYLTVLTGVNLLVGLGNAIFLWFLGVDFALLWGLLAWFMGYIPSIGFLIALIPPVLLAYAEYGLNTAVLVLVGYVVINGGVQNFYQPKVMGERLSISPVVVFIGLFIWGYLLGGIGAILAVPMTMLVIIIMENFDGTRTIAMLMRYTGEENKAEQQEALRHVKDVWAKTKKSFAPAKDESRGG